MALKDQMETVFKSSRVEQDPVSGNEVPTGSLPEEVRDDIPAQLSEGEYVIPADVVRYYGVRFFEDLRSQAKQGWQELEQGGRIGGDPVAPEGMEMGGDELPFDISELQVVDAAEGGYISGYAEGGAVDVAAIGQEFPGTIVGSGQPSQEWKTYRNAEGMTITIRFVNGEPVTPVPSGYSLYTEGQKAAEKVETQVQRSSDDKPPVAPTAPEEQIDFATADYDTLKNYVDQGNSVVAKGAAALAGAINPVLGLGLSAATRYQDKRFKDALQSRINAIPDVKDPERIKLEGLVNEVSKKSGKKVYGGESSLLGNIKDTDESGGASFGDTWLGDMLGFDGTLGVDAVDEKGNKLGLAESRAGQRRNKTNSSGTNTDSTPESKSENTFAQSVANFFTPNDGKSYQGGKLVEDKKEEDKP